MLDVLLAVRVRLMLKSAGALGPFLLGTSQLLLVASAGGPAFSFFVCLRISCVVLPPHAHAHHGRWMT